MVAAPVASLVYRLSRMLRARQPAAPAGTGTLSADEAAERYFHYEVDKAPDFDKKVALAPAGSTVLEIGSGCGGYLCHLLRSGVRFAYGVEPDGQRCDAIRRLLGEYYDGDNYRIVKADAGDLATIESGSVNLVVSDATIEHIRHLGRVLRETARILKPGGQAVLSTSPLWYHWNGGHTIRYIPIPWAHVFLPDRVMMRVLSMQRRNGDFPKAAMDNILVIYETIGKLSIRKLRKDIAASGLELVRFQHTARGRLRRALIRLPILEELFAGNVAVTLRKPVS